MSICRAALTLGLVVLMLSGCMDDKPSSMAFEACFHEEGAGLPSGWQFDATHWACESSPIARAFEVNTSTFPSPFTATSVDAAWDTAEVPWDGSSANLAISRGSGSLTSSTKDDHNAVYFLDDSHPSQLGWLAATLCHPKTSSSPESNDCDVRIFSKFLDVRDDPGTTTVNEEVTSSIAWSASNATGTTGAFRLPMAFTHELHHAVGFGHNNGIGSITEETIDKDQVAPSSVSADDENALLWVYGT